MRGGVVVLDKDGTLLRQDPDSTHPAAFVFMPGAPTMLVRLHSAGFHICMAANQPGVAFGRFQETALAGLEAQLRSQFSRLRVPFGGLFYCSHHPRGTVERYRRSCNGRKPAPGLIARAMTVWEATPDRTWFVGDLLDDVEAGRRARCLTILFDSGGETEWRLSPIRMPHFMTRRLETVVDFIVDS